MIDGVSSRLRGMRPLSLFRPSAWPCAAGPGAADSGLPGDLVDVMIWSPSSSARPGAFQFVVRTPEGSHTAFYKLPKGERPGTTAEAVTEWPWGRTQRGALMGLLDVGAIRFTHAVYLAHLPGGGYPGSFALTQHGLYMVHNGHEVIFPGKPWSPAPSGNADHNKKYDFNTYFTGLW